MIYMWLRISSSYKNWGTKYSLKIKYNRSYRSITSHHFYKQPLQYTWYSLDLSCLWSLYTRIITHTHTHRHLAAFHCRFQNQQTVTKLKRLAHTQEVSTNVARIHLWVLTIALALALALIFAMSRHTHTRVFVCVCDTQCDDQRRQFWLWPRGVFAL